MIKGVYLYASTIQNGSVIPRIGVQYCSLNHSGQILTTKIDIFWTPGTLDGCLERAKVALNNVVPCIGV